jgi:hypothetical protein
MAGVCDATPQAQTNPIGDNMFNNIISDKARRKAKERLNAEDPVAHIPHKSLVSTVELFETSSYGAHFNIGAMIREAVPKRLTDIDAQLQNFEHQMRKLEIERKELSRYMDVVAEMDGVTPA